MTRTRARRTGDDEGFTLVEVVVAVVLMALVMASVSVFFVKGISAATGLQRRSSAVQVADQAMQLARGVPSAESATGLSPLLKNRTRAAVEAQWTDAPAELNGTAPAWDPSPAGATPLLPLRTTTTVGTQTFTVDTFVGTCKQPTSGAVCSSSVLTVGQDAYRVVVRVRWSEGAGTSCAGGTCEYLATTLVNGKGDLVFNTSVDAARPVARADEATTAYQTDSTVNVLTNDSSGLRPSPVTMSGTPPLNGTFIGNTSNGLITYRPNPGFVGTDSFKYRITDSSDLTSDPATVTITVTAPAITAANDTLTVVRGATGVVDVRANDSGFFATPPAVTLRTPLPTQGTASVLGDGRVQYVAGGSAGTFVILYRITDTAGQFRDAQVVVTVTNPPATVADTASTTAPATVTVNVRTNDQAPLNTGTVTAATPANGTGTATISGNQVVYTPATGYSGTAVISYSVTGGGYTATGTLSVTVSKPPAATTTNLTKCVLKQGNSKVTVTVDLNTGITANRNTGGTFAVVGSLPTGYTGSLNAQTGVLTVTSNAAPVNGTLTWRFTDAWGTASTNRVLTLNAANSC